MVVWGVDDVLVLKLSVGPGTEGHVRKGQDGVRKVAAAVVASVGSQ